MIIDEDKVYIVKYLSRGWRVPIYVLGINLTVTDTGYFKAVRYYRMDDVYNLPKNLGFMWNIAYNEHIEKKWYKKVYEGEIIREFVSIEEYEEDVKTTILALKDYNDALEEYISSAIRFLDVRFDTFVAELSTTSKWKWVTRKKINDKIELTKEWLYDLKEYYRKEILKDGE